MKWISLVTFTKEINEFPAHPCFLSKDGGGLATEKVISDVSGRSLTVNS